VTPSHCPKCGNALRKNAAFCGYCGSDIHAPAVNEAPAPPSEPEPAQPESEVCQFCGKPLRTGARFCAGCGKAVHQPDVVGIQPDGEAPAEPPAHEEAAPLAFPLSGMAEAMEEPQVEFDEVAIPEAGITVAEDVQALPVGVANPTKQAQMRKIWIGLALLVVLGILAVIILPGLFGPTPTGLPDVTPVTSQPVVVRPTEMQATIEATPEPTIAPTAEPTPKPTTLPLTATLDPALALQPLAEDFANKSLSSDWVKTGTVGAAIETIDETRGGVLRLNSDVGKGILTYSPALPLTSNLRIQLTLISTSSAIHLQLFGSETQVAIGAVPLMSIQINKDSAQVMLQREDGAEVTFPLPAVDGKQAHLATILVSPTGMVSIEIDGAEVFRTTSDLMAMPPSGKVRFAMTGSAVIDDLQIQCP